MITLVSGEEKWRVTVDRATAVIKVQKAMRKHNWSLPPNYIFKDGVIIRTSKSISGGKTKEKGDPSGDMASKPVKVSHGDDTEKG